MPFGSRADTNNYVGNIAESYDFYEITDRISRSIRQSILFNDSDFEVKYI